MSKSTVTTLESGKVRMRAKAGHPETEAREARKQFRQARQALRSANFNALTNAQKIDALRDALVVIMQVLRPTITDDQDID